MTGEIFRASRRPSSCLRSFRSRASPQQASCCCYGRLSCRFSPFPSPPLTISSTASLEFEAQHLVTLALSLQAKILPLSSGERAAALRLPSGDLALSGSSEVNLEGQAATVHASPRSFHCGTEYSLWLLSALQGSLCAALRALSAFHQPPS